VHLKSWDSEARLKKLLAQIRKLSGKIDLTHLCPPEFTALEPVEETVIAKKRQAPSEEVDDPRRKKIATIPEFAE
jgi:hypothetical protein